MNASSKWVFTVVAAIVAALEMSGAKAAIASSTQQLNSPIEQNPASIESQALDLNMPADNLQAFRKLLCSVEDGKTVHYAWAGKAFSHRPGEADQHLFNVQGVSTRACTSLTSQTGSAGFRQVSREVMLYLNPVTNEVLETWQNPWTDEANTVLPVANDPVNSRPFWVETTGKELTLQSFNETDTVFLTLTIPLFYPNPLGGEYQSYAGGQYHAVEMFSFAANLTELTASQRQDVEEVSLSWSRISPWLPWMKRCASAAELHKFGFYLASYS